MSELDQIRRFYAEEICAVSNLSSEALVAALAKVPREHFLGPGPWQVMSPNAGWGRAGYRSTADADPRHLYHNVIVAVDREGRSHNGQPSGIALWIDFLSLRSGDSVLHVGCGVGYYTALIAEVVGTEGRVVAVEIDDEMAALARRNIAYLEQVEVVQADATQYEPGLSDAIFINTGVTGLRATWCDSLKIGGRLVVPLATYDGRGGMLKVTRQEQGYAARFMCPVMVLPCISVRNEEANRRLNNAFIRGAWKSVQSVLRHPHEQSQTCWLHDEGLCLSTLTPAL